MTRAAKIRSVFALFSAFLLLNAGMGAEALDLKVLYLGNAKSARAEEFRSFLSAKVARVGVTNRVGFDPALAKDYDVVLVDWPQSESRDEFPPKKSPLGELKDWVKPTVFLGSAGLHMAIVWDVKGGFG